MSSPDTETNSSQQTIPEPSPSPEPSYDPSYCFDRPTPLTITSTDVIHVRSKLQEYISRYRSCYYRDTQPEIISTFDTLVLPYFDSLDVAVKTVLCKYIYYITNITFGGYRGSKLYIMNAIQHIYIIRLLNNKIIIANTRDNKPVINTNTSNFIILLFIKIISEIIIRRYDLDDGQDTLINQFINIFNDSDYSFLINWVDVFASIYNIIEPEIERNTETDLVLELLSLILIYPFQTCTFNGNVNLSDTNLSEKFYNSMMYVFCGDENTYFDQGGFCRREYSLPCNTPQPAPAPRQSPQPAPAQRQSPQPAPRQSPQPAPRQSPQPAQAAQPPEIFQAPFTKTSMIVNSIDFRTNDGKCSIFSTPGGEYGDIITNTEDGGTRKYVYKTSNNKFFIVANPPATFATRKVYVIYPIEITNNCPGLSRHSISKRIFQNGITATTTQKPPTSTANIENFKNPFVAHLNIVYEGTTRPVNNLLESPQSTSRGTIQFYEDIIPRLINGIEFTTYQPPSQIVPTPVPKSAAVPIIPSNPNIVQLSSSLMNNTTTFNFSWTSTNAVSAIVSISPNTNTVYKSISNTGRSGQGTYTITNKTNIDKTYTITVTVKSSTENTASSTISVVAKKMKPKGGTRKRRTKKL